MESKVFLVNVPSVAYILISCTILWLVLSSKLKAYKLGKEAKQSSIPSLSKHWYLFGLDVIWQDIQDLRHNNSSHRAVLRHRSLGKTYISTMLGATTIHTIDPAYIATVTTERFADYEKGAWAKTISKFMGKGILVNDASHWQDSRKLLRPVFQRNRSADLKMFEPHVDRLIEYLRQNSTVFVDFRKALQMVVLDITTEMICGQSTSVLEASTQRSSGANLLNLIDEIEPYGNTAIELGPLAIPIFVLRYRKIMSLVRGIQGFFRNIVKDASQRPQLDVEGKTDLKSSFVDHILISEKLEEKVQGELQNVFFAAFDTTSALLANMFDLVARDTQLLERLRSEVSKFGGRAETITEASLSAMVLLRASIFETLRLHSPVTYHTRTARVDTILPHDTNQGVNSVTTRVPKGTTVTWSTYALNRQCGIYGADAELFRPQRWLEKDDQNGKPSFRLVTRQNFMPFGSGPRNCLGQQLAILLTSYIAARIFLEFDTFELENSSLCFVEAAAVTHYNGHGTRIRLRSWNA